MVCEASIARSNNNYFRINNLIAHELRKRTNRQLILDSDVIDAFGGNNSLKNDMMRNMID